MRVMVTFGHRFIRAPTGEVYTRGTVDYNFLSRYLAVFDEVIVLARTEDVDEIPPNKSRADGPNVSFFPVPYYFGPIQFLKRYREIKAKMQKAVDAADAYILRVAGPIGTLLWRCLMKKDIPYGIEVVSDPWDFLSPGSVKTRLRPFLRWKMTRDLVRQCRHASVASYVTKYSLQKRYPSNCWSTHYSTIDLPAKAVLDSAVVDKRMERIKTKENLAEPLLVCCSGQMSQLYKAQDILISAIAKCVDKGVNVELVLLGDGYFREQLEQQAASLSIADKVHFLGNIPAGQAVYEQLDEADVFVGASRQEGLPRAMIEAMARGLPCIGSTVGGIPELLGEEFVVPAGEVEPLAEKIEEVLADKRKLREMSRRNLEKAHEYCIDKLNPRRKAFYQRLSEITEAWRLKGAPKRERMRLGNPKMDKEKNERT